ncbi:Cytochrome P450 4c3-like protein, partial [Leptotrombidium deliense]
MSVIERRETRLQNSQQNNTCKDEDDEDEQRTHNNNGFNKNHRKPFLDNLLQLHFANPLQFTKVNIRDEVNTFLTAGHHTTSIALTFTVYLLGLHHDIQDKVYNEISEAFDGQRLRLNAVYKLKYLDAVIRESLRLYPPVPIVGRVTSHDTTVGEYVIPKGVSCAIPIMAIQRDPNVYAEPERFNPSRFL